MSDPVDLDLIVWRERPDLPEWLAFLRWQVGVMHDRPAVQLGPMDCVGSVRAFKLLAFGSTKSQARLRLKKKPKSP